MKKSFFLLPKFFGTVCLIAFILINNSCRKDDGRNWMQNNGGPEVRDINSFLHYIDPKNHIKPAEISDWIQQNIPTSMQSDLHLGTAQQRVINWMHVVQVSIAENSSLYFTKENGKLKVWAYKWQDLNPGTKEFSGNLMSYSFQDGNVTSFKYEKGQLLKWGIMNIGQLGKTPQSTKYRTSSLGELFSHFWCWLHRGDWMGGDLGCTYRTPDSGFGGGGAIATILQLLGDFFTAVFGDDGSGGGGGGEASYYIFSGTTGLPADPSTTNGSINVTPGGISNQTAPYGGGTIWIQKWVPDSSDGCVSNDPGNSDGGVDGPGGGVIPGPGGGCSAGDSGHWESIEVSQSSLAGSLITSLNITDTNKQTFIANNLAITTELVNYLVNNGYTPDNKDFINWAVEYLMANPSTDFTHFTKQFLTSFYPSTFRTISDNETAVNPLTGQTITFGEVKAIFENNPELIVAIESGNETSIFPSIIVWPTLQSIECEYELAVLSKLHPEWSKTRLFATALWNVWKDEYHFMLDVAGMFPVIGEAADLINGGIYYLEGDYINCAWSVSSAVPITGWVSTGAKWVKRARNAIHVSSIPAGAKAFRAIKNAKGAVRLVKLPVSTFAHTAINALQAIKPADNTLTNISARLVDQFSHRVKPVVQSLKNKIDDIVLHGDATGVKTEELADEIFTTNGFNKHEGRYGSNNGFDGIYIKNDASGHVQEIIINEAKQVKPQGNIQMGTTSNKGPQMSERWINETILEMRTNGNQAIQNLGNLLDANRVLIKKTVTAVDKSNSEIVILRLTNY